MLIKRKFTVEEIIEHYYSNVNVFDNDLFWYKRWVNNFDITSHSDIHRKAAITKSSLFIFYIDFTL
jgi:hypothetical protein